MYVYYFSIIKMCNHVHMSQCILPGLQWDLKELLLTFFIVIVIGIYFYSLSLFWDGKVVELEPL